MLSGSGRLECIFSQNKSGKDLQGIGKVPIFAVPKRMRDYEAQGRVRVIEEKKKKEKKSATFFWKYQKPSYLCNPKSGQQKPKGATPGGIENKIVKQLKQRLLKHKKAAPRREGEKVL